MKIKSFNSALLVTHLIAAALATVGCQQKGEDVEFRDRYKEEQSTGTVSGTSAPPAEAGAKADIKNPAAANDPTQTPHPQASPQSKKTKH